MVATLSFINMPDSSCPSLSANLTAAPPAPAAHDAAVGHGSIWTYSGETGPENWAKLSDDFKACGEGKRQSPINVKRVDAKSDVKLDLKLSMFSDMGQLLDNDFKNLVSATNNGHAVGVADASGFFTYQNVDYKLLQFNFHTPSEHRLDDTLYKAEVHLVHQSAAGKYLVVGFLIDEDLNSPAYWGSDILTKFPTSAEDSPKGALTLDYRALLQVRSRVALSMENQRGWREGSSVWKTGENRMATNFHSTMPQGLLGSGASSPYWTYSGSFTTPPCTEEVTWLISQNVCTHARTHARTLEHTHARAHTHTHTYTSPGWFPQMYTEGDCNGGPGGRVGETRKGNEGGVVHDDLGSR